MKALLFGFLAGCAETEEQMVSRLDELQKKGQNSQVMSEIDSYLEKISTENSTVLAEPYASRILRRSGDGSTLAWSQDDDIFMLRSDGSEEIDLPDPVADMQLSFNGSFAAVVLKKDLGCEIIPVNLEQDSILHDPVVSDCQSSAITDPAGKYMYFADSEGVHRIDLSDEESKTQKLLAVKSFPARYAKVPGRLELSGLPDGSMLIFFGSAGFYRLFHYRPDENKLVYLDQGFSRAEFYGTLANDPVAQNSAEKKETPAAGGARAPVRYAGHIIFGGSGRYGYRPVRTAPAAAVDGALWGGPASQIAFIQSRNIFYLSRKGMLTLWDPATGRYSPLPLPAAKFEIFAGGIVFEGRDRKLRRLQKDFSPAAMQLAALRSKAAGQIRQN